MALRFKQDENGVWQPYRTEQQEKSTAPKKPGRKKKTEIVREPIEETEEN